MNPLFNQLAGNMLPGNMQNIVNGFMQFRNGYRGDARQQVQMLLNSGKMSQAQFNQLSQMANQISRMIR